MKHDIAVKLVDISKRYYLHSEKPTLIESLNPLKRPQELWALKNINLTVRKGERIGVIGPNGSGKTTLLKIIAGITKPTSGNVCTTGKVASLIELAAGFHPEMNGIDNIFLNGIILGMTKAEVRSQLPKIIQYSGISQFINQPLYTYSEGMALRLGISILFHMKSDIFIFDENLFVGDKEFSEKVYKTLRNFFLKKKTLIIASHSNEIISRLCSRTFRLEKGQQKDIAET